METCFGEISTMCNTSVYSSTDSVVTTQGTCDLAPLNNRSGIHHPRSDPHTNPCGYITEMPPLTQRPAFAGTSTDDFVYSQAGERDTVRSFPWFESTMTHTQEFFSNQIKAEILAKQTYIESDPVIDVCATESVKRSGMQFGSQDQMGMPGGWSGAKTIPQLTTYTDCAQEKGRYSHQCASRGPVHAPTNRDLSETYGDPIKSETMQSSCFGSTFSNFESDTFSSASSSSSPLYIANCSDFEGESTKGLDAGDGPEKLYTKQEFMTIMPPRKVRKGGRTMAAREEGISDEEWERIKRRRERNKMAAQRCREKKRMAASKLVQENQELESSNTSLKYEVRKLQRYKLQLEGVLAQHTCKLACRGEHHSISPNLPHTGSTMPSSTCLEPISGDVRVSQGTKSRDVFGEEGAFNMPATWTASHKSRSNDDTSQFQDGVMKPEESTKLHNVYSAESQEQPKEVHSATGRSGQSITPPCGSRPPFCFTPQPLLKPSAAFPNETANQMLPFVSCTGTGASTLTQSKDCLSSRRNNLAFDSNLSTFSTDVPQAISNATRSLLQTDSGSDSGLVRSHVLGHTDLDDIQCLWSNQNTAMNLAPSP